MKYHEDGGGKSGEDAVDDEVEDDGGKAGEGNAETCSGNIGASRPAASSNNFISLATSLEVKVVNKVMVVMIMLMKLMMFMLMMLMMLMVMMVMIIS